MYKCLPTGINSYSPQHAQTHTHTYTYIYAQRYASSGILTSTLIIYVQFRVKRFMHKIYSSAIYVWTYVVNTHAEYIRSHTYTRTYLYTYIYRSLWRIPKIHANLPSKQPMGVCTSLATSSSSSSSAFSSSVALFIASLENLFSLFSISTFLQIVL